VEYLILGGAAVCLHGFTRMTNDVDILLNNTPENLAGFAATMADWNEGLGGDLTAEELQGPGCVRIVDGFPLDVFTLLNGKRYEDFDAKAVTYLLAGRVEVRCLSIPDLIELKKSTLREKDELDVVQLRRLQINPTVNPNPAIALEIPPGLSD
jgi:hypothetical protein